MLGKKRSRSEEIRGVEWDEDKRLRVWRERGIDFEDAAKILLGRVHEYQSDRQKETRFVAVGPMEDGTLIALVYTIRGQNIRVITARRAWKNEQRAYLHMVATPPAEGQD